ncbi:hypothetical protein [Micromonospora sp. WMMD812]|uniref:hypothetical protein n=1 Tax=Micromonospora sp. WMMD812 TaxID=3015152 RepID=UPI00248CBF94|nr:hypothetical protein [Micromonospora sp. WMMD812]WBB69204.1 hypothetical protein O7603_07605 [Micromonospora sp. WMMD812]
MARDVVLAWDDRRVDFATTVMTCLDHRAPILSREDRYGDLPVIYLPEKTALGA